MIAVSGLAVRHLWRCWWENLSRHAFEIRRMARYVLVALIHDLPITVWYPAYVFLEVTSGTVDRSG